MEGGSGSGGGGGVRVDVNEEASFCENSKKIYIFFFGGGGGGWAGEGGVRSGVGWGRGVARFGVGE